MMKLAKKNKLVIIHAVVWAALMLATAYFNLAGEHFNTVLIFLIGGWVISQSVLLSALKIGNTDHCASTIAKCCQPKSPT